MKVVHEGYPWSPGTCWYKIKTISISVFPRVPDWRCYYPGRIITTGNVFLWFSFDHGEKRRGPMSQVMNRTCIQCTEVRSCKVSLQSGTQVPNGKCSGCPGTNFLPGENTYFYNWILATRVKVLHNTHTYISSLCLCLCRWEWVCNHTHRFW